MIYSQTDECIKHWLFEEHEELLDLFTRFRELKTRDAQANSMELQEHATKVMSTLDEGIKELDDLDSFFEYLHQIGASHRKIPGFKPDYFWHIQIFAITAPYAEWKKTDPNRMAKKLLLLPLWQRSRWKTNAPFPDLLYGPVMGTSTFPAASQYESISLLTVMKIEKPFLEAVKMTLGDRYTDNVENIYKITIKLIIETLEKGYKGS
ncbi:hypothetical protein J6590_022522 [Homalodisca vitripennis]|nr:hypothetical protein J6590_022522 [Homalodisca vitripennis]